MPLRDREYPRLGEVAEQVEGMHEGQLNAAVRFLLANPAKADFLCSGSSFGITASDDRAREVAWAREHFAYRLRVKTRTRWFGMLASTEEDDFAQAEEAVRCALLLLGWGFDTSGCASPDHVVQAIWNRPTGRLHTALSQFLVKEADLFAAICRRGVTDRARPREDAAFLDREIGLQAESSEDLVAGALMLIGRERFGRHTAPASARPAPVAVKKVALALIVRASKLGGLPSPAGPVPAERVEAWLGAASYFYGETLPDPAERSPQLDVIEANLDLTETLPASDAEQEVYLRVETELPGGIPGTSRPLLQQALRREGISPIRIVRLAGIDMLASAAKLTPFTIA